MDDEMVTKEQWTRPTLEALEMRQTAQNKITPGVEGEVEGGAGMPS